MKKRLQILVLILGLSILGAGCGEALTNDDNPSGTHTNETLTENNDKLSLLRPVAYRDVTGLNLEPGSHISIIGRYDDGSYWEELEKGAEQAIDDINSMLGYKGDDKVQLSYVAPSTVDDIDEQVSILDEELARYPLAICISAVDTTACLTQFELAQQDRIPIITFDSGSEYDDVGAHISTDNDKASATVAKELAALMGESGQAALIVQDSISMTGILREQGFMNEIAKFPNISVPFVYHLNDLEDMAEQIADEINLTVEDKKDMVNPEELSHEDVILYLMEQHPDLDAIYTTNLDTTQLVAELLDDEDIDDLIFVGFDGGKEQMELLEDEVVDGLVLQNPYGMGYATVVAAARTALGLPNEAYINSGYTWITKATMENPTIQQYIY